MSRKSDKLLIEKALRERQKIAITKKNMTEWYSYFASCHNMCMRHILTRYKERGDFGVSPMLLADRYENEKDKEVALVASLFVRSMDIDMILSDCNTIAEIITDRPYIWLCKRGFVALDDPTVRTRRVCGGTTMGDIATVMQKLWEIYSDYGTLERYCHSSEVSANPSEMLVKKLVNFGIGYRRVSIGDKVFRCSLILARLSCKDGMGLGLWEEPVKNLFPIDKCVRTYLKNFFFDRSDFTLGEKLSLMGMKDGMELYYASHAYKEMMSENPKEYHRYESFFSKWLSKRCEKKRSRLIEVMPKDFAAFVAPHNTLV